MKAATLAAALRIFAAELERLEEAERDQRRGWTAQTESPIPPRMHIACVRRLVAAGDANAAQIGRKYLLSPSAVATELARLSQRPARKAKASVAAPVMSMVDRLEGARRSAR